MPIITFNGIKKERVDEYYKNIDEICELIKANKENVFFVVNNNEIINSQKTAYITVEWIQRLDKEELLTNHLKTFFANDVEKIAIFYTDVNSKLYLNGNKLG